MMTNKQAFCFGGFLGLVIAFLWMMAAVLAEKGLEQCQQQRIMNYKACKLEVTK